MSIDKFGRSIKYKRDDSYFKVNIFGDLDCNGRKITNVDDPDDTRDVATKSYVIKLGNSMQEKVDLLLGKIEEKLASQFSKLQQEESTKLKEELNKKLEIYKANANVSIDSQAKTLLGLITTVNDLSVALDSQKSMLKAEILKEIKNEQASSSN